MKTLTTLTAIAALFAGMSFAGAQNAPSTSGKQQPPSSINAGAQGSTPSGMQSGASTMSKSATQNKKITGTGKFCISSAPGSNELDCKFASMAACEKMAKSDNKQCSENPKMATTGSKSKMK